MRSAKHKELATSELDFYFFLQYYAYPENMRPRISQMLVLPPFQRQGLGAKLLHAVSKHYWSIPKVVDITGRTKFFLIFSYVREIVVLYYIHSNYALLLKR